MQDSFYKDRHFLNGDEKWWDQVLGVNLKGAFLCSHRAAHIMAAKRYGIIINMSSGGATKAHRGNVAYDASKGGIEAMTRAMALDLAPYGVRVNAIVPGLIRTYDISDEIAIERGKVVPIGRLGTPEDLSGPTIFLKSCACRCCTNPCRTRASAEFGTLWRLGGHVARRVEQTPAALPGHGGPRRRGHEVAIGTRCHTQRFANRG